MPSAHHHHAKEIVFQQATLLSQHLMMAFIAGEEFWKLRR